MSVEIIGQGIPVFISENYKWLFSGAGLIIVSWIFKIIKGRETISETAAVSNKIDDSSQNTSTATVNVNINENTKPVVKEVKTKDKCSTKILFVDDDTKFNVINIIKNSGWKSTKILKDINSMDSHEVTSTDIFFIDIRGVGKKLGFQDEGLGLAQALKTRYPDKKVVIYSAEQRGDRFHEGLRKADDFLAKNAEPFEFLQTIERLS